ncbi:hypothetical protein IMAU20067_00699 [Lactobacillus helveticus]|uniref:hypothetical protein n=1 Tax=Lactobacillus helveticus TaxID=1587 RepID=UPI001561F79E|nr:hypothetical protein [Lactobacillus helveticus]NRO73865.1 hypothetical protein [Lactobacillus helveticus]
MIKYSKNSWYYSDDTVIKFAQHSPPAAWVSKDKIIRLIDYDNKDEANEMIKEIERILYNNNDN